MARARWLAGVVVSALLLTGCSGDEPAAEPPRPSAPTSPVTTTSPTPAPAPPELPAAARKNTKAGAVAFAHHYIDLVNYVRRSGAAAPLRQASSRACESCSAIAEIAEMTYADGGYLHGGSWSVIGSSGFPVGQNRLWQVVARIEVAEQAYLPRAGARVERRRAEAATLLFLLARLKGHWVVSSLERQSDE